MAKVTQVQNDDTGLAARTAYNEAIKNVEVDGTTITGNGTTEDPLTSTSIPEAPNDGKTYGRKDEGWTEINPSGAGLPEAPLDGQSYARNGLGNNWESAFTKAEANLAFDSKGSADAVQNNLDAYEISNDAELVAINAAKQDKSPVDGVKYVLLDGSLQAIAVQNDPPQDGSSYAVNNGVWVQVAIQTDAPQDGQTWGRKNGAWVVVTGGTSASDYVMSSYPQDGESISSTEIPLITLNNPSFLQDGTTPIDSTNIDSLITLEQDPNGTPTSFPFDATVDYSRRVISVTPTTEFTKGEEYQLTCSALKDSEGDQSGSINVSFTATYTPGFQAILDKIESNGETPPDNLNDLEQLYIGMDNLGLFTNGSMFTFNISRTKGTQNGMYRVNWVDPDFAPTTLTNTQYFEGQGSKGTSSINGGLRYLLTNEMIASFRDNSYRTLFDRFDTGGGSGDYIAGVNGNGISGFGSADSVRTRHDASGTGTGIKLSTTQRNGDWNTLLDNSNLGYGIGGVNRGIQTTRELCYLNPILGFISSTQGFSTYLADFTTVYNQYLTTL